MTNPIDRKYLRRLRVLGFVEGVSTLLLFGVAMPLKYAADMPMAVTVVGMIHGVLFMWLAVLFVFGIDRVPMSTRMAWVGVTAAILPFGPFLMDRRLARLGD